MNMNKKKIIVGCIALVPTITLAAPILSPNMSFKDLLGSILRNIIQPGVELILGGAIVFFLWNIMQVIRKSDQPDELAKLKSKAVWGVIAIFVMVSMWALVGILANTFTPGQGVQIPRV